MDNVLWLVLFLLAIAAGFTAGEIAGYKRGTKFVARVIACELEDCSYEYSKHPGGVYRRLRFALDKYL